MAAAAPPLGTQQPQSPPVAGAPAAAETALVPSPHQPLTEIAPSPDSPVNRLLVELELAVPVRDFRVRNLLALEPGTVVESQWKHGDDLPLSAPGVQLAWTEFEVVETQLAARLTRLA